MSKMTNNYLMLGENNPDIAAQQAEMSAMNDDLSAVQMAMAESCNKNQFIETPDYVKWLEEASKDGDIF